MSRGIFEADAVHQEELSVAAWSGLGLYDPKFYAPSGATDMPMDSRDKFGGRVCAVDGGGVSAATNPLVLGGRAASAAAASTQVSTPANATVDH